ncbi:hypothetical protein BegalDRAFT_2115, partial [Beggiatoa alba B18LD]
MQFVDTPISQRAKKRRMKTLQKTPIRSHPLALFMKYVFIPLFALCLWLFVRINVHFNDTHEVGQRL